MADIKRQVWRINARKEHKDNFFMLQYEIAKKDGFPPMKCDCIECVNNTRKGLGLPRFVQGKPMMIVNDKLIAMQDND
jgi:hypothetical protein